jgi:hypothetical protein
MLETLDQITYPECARINMAKEAQVSFWTRELCINEARLRQAVTIAGPILKDVKAFLSGSESPQDHDIIIRQYRIMVDDILSAYVSDIESVKPGDLANFKSKLQKAFGEELELKAEQLLETHEGLLQDEPILRKELQLIASRGLEQFKIRTSFR